MRLEGRGVGRGASAAGPSCSHSVGRAVSAPQLRAEPCTSLVLRRTPRKVKAPCTEATAASTPLSQFEPRPRPRKPFIARNTWCLTDLLQSSGLRDCLWLQCITFLGKHPVLESIQTALPGWR